MDTESQDSVFSNEKEKQVESAAKEESTSNDSRKTRNREEETKQNIEITRTQYLFQTR